MPQSVTTQCDGLHTYNSDVASVPVGSLKLGTNISLNKENLIIPRKGFTEATYDFPTSTDRCKGFYFWQNEELMHVLHADTSETLQAQDGGGTGFSTRGTLTTPTCSDSVSFCSASNKNLYMTSNEGIRKMDSIGSSHVGSGVPTCGVFWLISTNVGTGTAIAANETAYYRGVICLKDANGNIHKGGVSSRAYVPAETSIYDVTGQVFLPAGLTTNHFIQIYRISGSSTIQSDEMQLFYEKYLTSTDISDGHIHFTDITPASYLGATIYTAVSQEGIVSNNELIPSATDIAEFKNHLFLSDVTYAHKLPIRVATISSLADNDTLTISDGTTSEVFTFKTSPNYIDQIPIDTNAGQAGLFNEASWMSYVIDRGSTLVRCYHVDSDVNMLKGYLLFESKTGDEFTIVSSRPSIFDPQATSPATTLNTSKAEHIANGLSYSKPFQMEAFPLKNVLKIGSSSNKILKIVALSEALFIFKENEGIHILRGDSEANFRVEMLDGTAHLISSKSIAVVNNMIYGLFKSGICEVSETGVSIISQQIKDQVDSFITSASVKFSVGDDINGRYILSIQNSATKQIVYDTFNKKFLNWNLYLNAIAFNPVDKKIYIASSTANRYYIENQYGDYQDYADVVIGVSISSHSGDVIVVTQLQDSSFPIAKGDLITQGAISSYVESVSGNNITMDGTYSWSNAACSLLKAIPVVIEWNPDYCGNSAQSKHFYEFNLMSKSNFQKEATFTFYSDENPSEREVAIPMTDDDGYGLFGNSDFGNENFGGYVDNKPYRVGIPRDHARANSLSVRFSHSVAYTDFSISGKSISFNPVSTRICR